MPKPRIPLTIRIRSKSEVDSITGCWLWQGQIQKGYPSIWIRANGKAGRKRGNRMSYEAFKGPIPEGLLVLHSCDNPLCVNPDHLRTGTARDNARDMVERKRNRLGEQHPHAKFSEADVLEIRRLRTEGARVSRLAEQFETSISNIHSILSRRTWRHI